MRDFSDGKSATAKRFGQLTGDRLRLEQCWLWEICPFCDDECLQTPPDPAQQQAGNDVQ